MTQPHPHLIVETSGPVRTLTLDNPQRRNAQTPTLWRALATEVAQLPEEVRVIVLRGNGPSFSAGIDTRMFTAEGVPGEEPMTELVDRGHEGVRAAIAGYQEGFLALSRCPAVVVAEVQGYAIGAGFQLALAADLRVASDDASFEMREPSLGIVPDLVGTKHLVDLVGYSGALELCATRRAVGAEEALRMGLVNLVVPSDQLREATASLTEAMLSAAPGALRALKPLLRGAVDSSLEDQARAEREAQSGLLLGLLTPGSR